MDFFQLIEEGKKNCLRNAPAPCSAACPLGIDIRDFIQKFGKGLVAAAYKAFSLNAVLPGTVCHICPEPCQDHCIRKDVDTAVALKELERFCWQKMHKTPKRSYYIREKKERILICGGGPAALSAAVKLARRGYPVDLAVKEDRIGGSLWELDDTTLPKDILEEDLQAITSEKYVNVLWETSGIPQESIAEYDAVLLTEQSYDPDGTWREKDGVFQYEQRESPLEDIYQGNILSQQLEEYVKIRKVFMTKEMEREAPYVPKAAGIEKKERILPTDTAHWTQEEAMDEAGRCLQCRCNLCADVCPMMQHYHQDYHQTASAVLDTVEAQEIDRKRGLYPLMSCMQCGACMQVCPAEVDTRALCISARRLIHKKKILPTAHYHFWLQDMEHADHTVDCMIPAEENCRYVYFPGCQMGASRPAYVEHSYEWLRQLYPGQAALWSRCCGAPAYWAGNEALHEEKRSEIRSKWKEMGEPAFILSCPTCMEQFREHFPEIEIVSLWSLLAEHLPQARQQKGEIAIFDSCAARNDLKLQADIRRILFKVGYDSVELERNGEETRCCGYGGLVYSTNPDMIHKVIQDNAVQSELPYATYCTNCMDSFRLNGKEAWFLLDLVFGQMIQQESPDLTKRRQNRMTLKKRMLQRYGKDEKMEDRNPYQDISLEMDAAVKAQINRQLLLEDDIRCVIGSVEESGVFLYDADSGERIAHKQTGYITVWVRYRPLDNGAYQVCSTYFHRMKLKGEEDGRE